MCGSVLLPQAPIGKQRGCWDPQLKRRWIQGGKEKGCPCSPLEGLQGILLSDPTQGKGLFGNLIDGCCHQGGFVGEVVSTSIWIVPQVIGHPLCLLGLRAWAWLKLGSYCFRTESYCPFPVYSQEFPRIHRPLCLVHSNVLDMLLHVRQNGIQSWLSSTLSSTH